MKIHFQLKKNIFKKKSLAFLHKQEKRKKKNNFFNALIYFLFKIKILRKKVSKTHKKRRIMLNFFLVFPFFF